MRLYDLRDHDIVFASWYFVRDRLLRSIKNVKARYQISKDARGSNYSQRILSLKDAHLGETCVIVGNGPSSRPEDFRLIQSSGIDSFGVNRILDSVEDLEWRPTYLSVMDPGFLISRGRTTNPEQYGEKIKRFGIESVFLTDDLRPYASAFPTTLDPIFFRVLHTYNYSEKLPCFSDNPALYVADLGNVTHFNIQLACFMGYKKIVLYGVDNTYTKYFGHDGTFHRKDKEEGNYLPGVALMESEKAQAACVPKYKFQGIRELYADLRKIDLGFGLCKEYADSNGIRILNATRGGSLDVFDRASLEDCLFESSLAKNYPGSDGAMLGD